MDEGTIVIADKFVQVNGDSVRSVGYMRFFAAVGQQQQSMGFTAKQQSGTVGQRRIGRVGSSGRETFQLAQDPSGFAVQDLFRFVQGRTCRCSDLQLGGAQDSNLERATARAMTQGPRERVFVDRDFLHITDICRDYGRILLDKKTRRW